MKIDAWMSGLRSRIATLVNDSRKEEKRRRAEEAERRWQRRIGVVVKDGSLYLGMDGVPLVDADDLVAHISYVVEKARGLAAENELKEGGLR